MPIRLEHRKKPNVAVVITHHNYSELIEPAIDSVLKQTYENVQCVVVDDCSDPLHADPLRDIVARKSGRVKLILQDRNIGQIPAFYAGCDSVAADFCCLLDPDDRYMQTFIEEMVFIHLNPYIFVPLVSCDQIYLFEERQITGFYIRDKELQLDKIDPKTPFPYTMRFFDWGDAYWPWSSTSSMMVRKDALGLMRPISELPTKRSADAYLGQGARYLGGSIVFNKPLVMRSVHSNNSFLDPRIISSKQIRNWDGIVHYMPQCAEAVFINILKNGGLAKFGKKHFRKILLKEYSYPAIRRMMSQTEELQKVLSNRHLVCSAMHHLSQFGLKKGKMT